MNYFSSLSIENHVTKIEFRNLEELNLLCNLKHVLLTTKEMLNIIASG